jgi:hypothetical protein
MMLGSTFQRLYAARESEWEALMPLRSWSEAHRGTLLIVRLLGFCLFVAAFFLPAVRSGPVGPEATVFPGWKCASIALGETVALFGKSVSGPPSFEVLLVVLSGWINPLALLLMCFGFSRGFAILRRVLAAMILLCMAATWNFFALQKLSPLAGHFLWIAGALLILIPAAIPGGQKLVGGAPSVKTV